VVAVGLAGCTRAQVDEGLSGSDDISGSSTVYPVTTAMQELFADEYRGVDIAVTRDGTSGVIVLLALLLAMNAAAIVLRNRYQREN
jgi:ABC-type phosphate transport system substrate-binding protein